MIYIGLVGVIFAIDWIIKRHIEKHKKVGQEETILKEKLIIARTNNYGSAFGAFAKYPKFIKGSMLFVIGLVLWIFVKLLKEKKNGITKVGMALILGGGLSNIYDRFRNGYVTDYLIFPVKNDKIRHTVFNVSDLSIFVGAIGILFGNRDSN